MLSLSKQRLAFGTLVAAGSSVMAFQPGRPAMQTPTRTSLNMVAVDPGTVTKKDYEDICGVSFDEGAMMERLQSTKFLYPKHVEVIEDIAPIAGEMVDELVRCDFCGESKITTGFFLYMVE